MFVNEELKEPIRSLIRAAISRGEPFDQVPIGDLEDYFLRNQGNYSMSVSDFRRRVIESSYRSILFDEKITVDSEPSEWRHLNRIFRDRNLDLGPIRSFTRHTLKEVRSAFLECREVDGRRRSVEGNSRWVYLSDALDMKPYAAKGLITYDSRSRAFNTKIEMYDKGDELVGYLLIEAMFLQFGTSSAHNNEGAVEKIERQLHWLLAIEDWWRSNLLG